MRRVKFALLGLVLALSISASAAFAGHVQFRSIGFSLGSLITSGELTGLGSQDVTVKLKATGVPEVTCTNQGGNQAPGQNPPKVSATGSQFLVHDNYTKNGNSPFSVETASVEANLSAKQLGCPNDTWTAAITFVYWTNAHVSVNAGSATGDVLLQENFACTTTKTSVTCTPAP
jgi:hypothetical protein